MLSVFITGGLYFIFQKPESPVLGTRYEKEIDEPDNSFDIKFSDKMFRFNYLKANPESLYLLPNFIKKGTGKAVAEANECKFLVNAGFYSSDENSLNYPIGLFIHDGVKASSYRENKTHNGLLSINHLDTPRITDYVPEDNLRNAVQTGPLLIVNDEPQSLVLVRDKMRRRMVAATTGANELYFIAVYDPGSTFNGPYLSDLPDILKIFETESMINIADAINLDGGAASVFYSEDFYLSEASPVGSFFCGK